MFQNFLTKAKVLIVDDAAANIRLLERLLHQLGGIDVVSTQDARKAVSLFEEHKPDLVLLDLHMPHLDGFEVLAELKPLIPADAYLPILVLTGDLHTDSRRRALASGAKDFATKPLDAAEVLLRIQNLLETRALYVELQKERLLLEQQVIERTRQLQNTLVSLREAQDKMIKQERLSAVGTMAAGVAHDFNNALTMILGYGELLLPFFEEHHHPLQRGYVNTVVLAAQDAAQIVGRLSNFFRPKEEDEPRLAVHLNELVNQSIALTMPKWRDQSAARAAQLSVQTSLEEQLPPILGNAAELREMLMNLIFNAVDAMPRGGVVALRTFSRDQSVFVEVADNGTGMTEETQRRCLEPFFTTKHNRGTGLGLSAVYGIIQRHGGSIKIDSQRGRGSRFLVGLPVVAPSSVIDQSVSEKLEHPLRVLTVDDQPVIREVVRACLAKDGHWVDVASDGEEAFEKFKTHQYDLVITDFSMPRMDGKQLAGAIKRMKPSTPIILLTDFAQVMRESGAPLDHVDTVLGKPVHLAELRKAIIQVMTIHSLKAA